jgi:hypothetical protein
MFHSFMGGGPLKLDCIVAVGEKEIDKCFVKLVTSLKQKSNYNVNIASSVSLCQ